MPAPPLAFFLLPDPLLAGAGDGPIMSSSLADGLTGGVVSPNSRNQGMLTVVQSGPVAARTNITYRLVASGGIWNEATWAWKEEDETFDRDEYGYRGANDGRYFWACHCPHTTDSDFSRSLNGVYSKKLRTEFVYHANASDSVVRVAYRRTLNDHAYSPTTGSSFSWTLANCINRDSTFALKIQSGGYCVLEVVELYDGQLLMVTESADVRDLDVFISSDGINWTPRADQILARFSIYGTLGSDTFEVCNLSRSGNYLRLCFNWLDVDNVSGYGATTYVRTLVSSDRGATWLEVTSLHPNFAPENVSSLTGKYLFAMGGIDDPSGACMLIITREGDNLSAFVATATGNEPWAFVDNLDITFGAATVNRNWCIARGPSWIYVLQVNKTTSSHGWKINSWRIDPRDYTNPAVWYEQLSLDQSLGSIRYAPGQLRAYDCGKTRLALVAGLHDLSGGGGQIDDGYLYMRFGGWDPMPAEERDHPKMQLAPNYMHQPGWSRSKSGTSPYQLPIVVWDAWMGTPTVAGAGDSATTSQWERPFHSNTVQAWNVNRVKYTDQAAVANRWWNRFTDTLSTFSWAAATVASVSTRSSCMVETVLRVPTGGSMSQDDVAARLKAWDVNSGTTNSIDVSLRFNSSGVVGLYDNAATSLLFTAAVGSSLATQFWKFRLGLLSQPWFPGDPVGAVLSARSEVALTDQWTILGTASLNLNAGHTIQSIAFGHYESLVGAQRDTEWRRVAVYGPHDGGSTRIYPNAWGDFTGTAVNDDSVLDNLRGREVTAEEVHVVDGIYAAWGGGGGMEGDTYAGEVGETYGPRNITAVGSPRVGFRSAVPTSGTTQSQVTYDAAWSRTGNRFHHDSIGVFGYSSQKMTVSYSDAADFSSLSALYTLNTARWTALVITAHGNAIEIMDPVGAPFLGEEASGQGALKHYLRISELAAGACTSLLGTAYEIERVQRYGVQTRALHLATTTTLSTLGLAGSTVTIYADRGVVVYDAPVIARYMRLTMLATMTPYANQHRLGTVVAGNSLTLTVPMEWTHTDSEMPNTTEYVTRGAVRWAYEEGPAQRVVEGRVAGDTVDERDRIRRYLRFTSRYDVYPVVFCDDGQQLTNPDRLLLACVKSGAEFSQLGWAYDAVAGRWHPVGDMKIKLYEEV